MNMKQPHTPPIHVQQSPVNIIKVTEPQPSSRIPTTLPAFLQDNGRNGELLAYVGSVTTKCSKIASSFLARGWLSGTRQINQEQ